MKLHLNLKESIYNCQIIISNQKGSETHIINTLDENGNDNINRTLEIDIDDSDFDITLTPTMVNYKKMLNILETNTWKDKFAKKISNKLLSLVDSVSLRVGCKYHVSNTIDNDTLTIELQGYLFGLFDRLDLFGLYPLSYMFYEISNTQGLLKLTNTFTCNRKDVIKSAKAITLANFGLHLIFTYPFQVGRIKYLTKEKKVTKTLIKFNNMNDEERKKFLARQESLIS